jgi:hypothetical protein
MPHFFFLNKKKKKRKKRIVDPVQGSLMLAAVSEIYPSIYHEKVCWVRSEVKRWMDTRWADCHRRWLRETIYMEKHKM